MLTAALRACRPARADVTVAQARAEALPFRDATFDAVILAWSM
jgi:ubiquinone/menaquinone biosynthesis C-methylase UbiE